jgi:CheY-like chemotaxis protein
MTVRNYTLSELEMGEVDVSTRPMKKGAGGCEGKQANIAVVDDDQSIRESLPDLLSMLGFIAQAFSSPVEFLASDFFRETDCLILDITMEGMSGPQLQTELKRLGSKDSNHLHHGSIGPIAASTPGGARCSGLSVKAGR